MQNRGCLRVQKKKRSGRRKVLLKKFFDYLKSDTFMYAPLLSPQPSRNAFKVVELKKPIKENKCFGDKVREYLKSDVYMYHPMLPPSPQGRDVSSGRSTMKVNQHTDRLQNVNQRSETESHLPQTYISDHHTWGHKETVKHTVYQSCRSTLPSRNGTLISQLRAHD